MNKLISTFILLILITSCGRPQKTNCQDSTLNILCHTIYQENPNTDLLNDVNNRLTIVEAVVKTHETRISALELLDYHADLNNSINSILSNLTTINNELSSLAQMDTTIQTELNSLSTIVQTLQSSAISEVINLCGNDKEVLLRLGNNDLVALFVSGHKKHRLQKLTPGSYESSDGEHCHFTVNNDLSITY